MFMPIGDENVIRRTPWVNYGIIIANTIIFFTILFYPQIVGAQTLEDAIWILGVKPYQIAQGKELWTIFTSMFMHAGIIHLLGNMWFLAIFGDNIEAIMGHLRYLVFYILSGIGATIFHLMSVALMPPSALLNQAYASLNPWTVPAVGASGAISGVLGAYILTYPNSRVRVFAFWFFLPVTMVIPASLYIGFWFLFQLFMGFWTLTGIPTGVAYWAHVGGFITGMGLVYFFADKKLIRIVKSYLYGRFIGFGWGRRGWG